MLSIAISRVTAFSMSLSLLIPVATRTEVRTPVRHTLSANSKRYHVLVTGIVRRMNAQRI
jgi:hypothetical protein